MGHKTEYDNEIMDKLAKTDAKTTFIEPKFVYGYSKSHIKISRR